MASSEAISSASTLFAKVRVVNLFVLRFYSPVNPMVSCRARSVYLTTRLLVSSRTRIQLSHRGRVVKFSRIRVYYMPIWLWFLLIESLDTIKYIRSGTVTSRSGSVDFTVRLSCTKVDLWLIYICKMLHLEQLDQFTPYNLRHSDDKDTYFHQ